MRRPAASHGYIPDLESLEVTTLVPHPHPLIISCSLILTSDKLGNVESGSSSAVDETCSQLQRHHMIAVENARAIFYSFLDNVHSKASPQQTEEEYELQILDDGVTAKQQFSELVDDIIRTGKGLQDKLPKPFRARVAKFRHEMVKIVAGLLETLRGYLETVATAFKNHIARVLTLLQEVKVKAECAAAKALSLITGGAGGTSGALMDIIRKRVGV